MKQKFIEELKELETENTRLLEKSRFSTDRANDLRKLDILMCDGDIDEVDGYDISRQIEIECSLVEMYEIQMKKLEARIAELNLIKYSEQSR